MLLEQIRQVTAANHEKLESQLIPYLNSIETKVQYARLLRAFYGYIYPVQEKINTYINAEIVPDISQRRNAVLLLNDLTGLGLDVSAESCDQLPDIKDHATAMGALYVLEGSTLGGKTISKMLVEKLGPDVPISFFGGYGNETGSMWKKFIQQLEHPSLTASSEATSTAASETFRLFGTWLEQQLTNTYTV